MITSEAFGTIGLALVTVVLGWLGWKIAERLHFPAPALIGPMILVGLATSLGVAGMSIPSWFRIIIQSVIGGYIGRRVDRTAIKVLSRMLPAIVFTTTWYVAMTTALGLLVASWANIDLGTAFLATAPGGVAEMTAMAISGGADVAFVATFQALRVMATNIAIPLLARRGTVPSASGNDEPGNDAPSSTEFHWTIGLVAALAGGTLFTMAGIPAAGVVGSMFVIAALRLGGFAAAPVPRIGRDLAYIGLGISVGVNFDSGTLARLQSSAEVLVFGTLATLIGGFLLALVVRRIMRLDYRTAMLACSPGGLSLMAVVAEETGAQSLVVSVFQLFRIIWVILAMPLFLRLLG